MKKFIKKVKRESVVLAAEVGGSLHSHGSSIHSDSWCVLFDFADGIADTFLESLDLFVNITLIFDQERLEDCFVNSLSAIGGRPEHPDIEEQLD